MNDFIEQLKAKINVAELYTELSGEQFVYVKAKSRNLAKVAWRQDITPSLSHYPNKNILTDFAGEPHPETGKSPNYNPIDIFLLVGGAATYTDAITLCCKRVGIELPKEFKRKDDESKSLL